MTTTGKSQGEKDEHRRLRDRLLEAEIALKDQRERVAVLRRELPMGPRLNPTTFFARVRLTFKTNLPPISRTFVSPNYLPQARTASSWIT